MSFSNPLSLGRRIAINLQRREMSVEELARKAGVPREEVKRLAAGAEPVSRRSQIESIARALDVPVYELLGEVPPTRASPKAHELALAVRSALVDRDLVTFVGSKASFPAEPSLNTDRIEDAWTFGHASDFAALVTFLPALIRDSTAGPENRGIDLAAISDVYQLTSAMMAAIGESDLAWVCADRALLAAEVAKDAVRIAASYFRLAITLLHKADYEGVVRAVASGTSAVSPDLGDDAASMRGALLLCSAVAHARAQRGAPALEAISEARRVAAALGRDGNVMHTEFGPTNVALHELAILVEIGHPSEARRCAANLSSVTLSRERQSRAYIDLARADFQLRDFKAMARSLREAFLRAPQAVTENWFVREMLQYMVNSNIALPRELGALQRAAAHPSDADPKPRADQNVHRDL